MTGLLSFFRIKKLKPAWEFDAGAIIWRIFFNSENKIVGESRNESTKTTSFFCIDANSGRPLWNNLEINEPWWVGIETVGDRWVVLHGYNRPDMPEHRGIQLVEIDTGKLKWKNDDATFWFMDRKNIYAQKYLYEKRIGYELDINTGEIIEEYSDNLDVLYDKRKNALQEKINEQNDILFPELYLSDKADPSINEIVRCITNGEALNGWIEYFVNKGILTLSYYQREKKDGSQLLANILKLYNLDNNKLLFNRIIDRELQAPNHDTFFIKIPFIYFINNRSMLTALQPWKS
jgi:hypothetical protein